MLPLVPLLVPLFLGGIAHLVGRGRPEFGTAAAMVLAAVLAATGCSRTWPLLRDGIACDRGSAVPSGSCIRPDTRSYVAAAASIRTALPPDAVLLSAKPATLYWLSGRRSVPRTFIRPQPDTTLLARAREAGAGWILLGSVHAIEVGRMGPALRRACRELAAVDAFPPRTLLLRIKAVGEAAAPDACGALEQWRTRNLGRDFETDLR
jgi:hypothetical protein